MGSIGYVRIFLWTPVPVRTAPAGGWNVSDREKPQHTIPGYAEPTGPDASTVAANAGGTGGSPQKRRDSERDRQHRRPPPRRISRKSCPNRIYSTHPPQASGRRPPQTGFLGRCVV
ncbi:hypothetical protein DQ04_00201100 [Trypanosoma grayi]|uniref:hypothetical protein n=1 Tax=Trypanosoma grayi TaxID=71804 RepID=UPI0004F4AAF2|nr:hypothetical protein DQ04_00201100 [Trypanosoma grayi]KEG15057.1 hypothetical protein DQ04_00201100 [Trypanosoma grayi]